VTAPSNTQNDRVYAPVGVRKKNIAPSRFYAVGQHSAVPFMVSVGVSALGRTDLHFIDAGLAPLGASYNE